MLHLIIRVNEVQFQGITKVQLDMMIKCKLERCKSRRTGTTL